MELRRKNSQRLQRQGKMCLEEGVEGKGLIWRGRDGDELAFGAQTITLTLLAWMPVLGSGEGNSHFLGQEEQCEGATLVPVLGELHIPLCWHKQGSFPRKSLKRSRTSSRRSQRGSSLITEPFWSVPECLQSLPGLCWPCLHEAFPELNLLHFKGTLVLQIS